MQQQPTNTFPGAEIIPEKIYDLCMIEKFCRGNQEQIKKMVKVFIEQIPRSVEEIKAAYISKDFATMKSVAHRIKPIINYYAIVKIEEDILQIEAMTKEELGTMQLEHKIVRLDNVLTTVIARMKKDFEFN